MSKGFGLRLVCAPLWMLSGCFSPPCEPVFSEPPTGEVVVPGSLVGAVEAGEVRVLLSGVSLVLVFPDGSTAVYEPD